MASIALRTRFSAQLVSALSPMPMVVLQALAFPALFGIPLWFAFVESPLLIILSCGPFSR